MRAPRAPARAPRARDRPPSAEAEVWASEGGEPALLFFYIFLGEVQLIGRRDGQEAGRRVPRGAPQTVCAITM